MGHVDEDDFSVVSDLAMDDSERPGNRRGVRNRLGVALGGIRRPSQNRQAPALEGESRGWLGRLGGSNPSSQDIDGFQKPQVPVKLKNVKVDAGADFESMIGPPISDIPLRKLHGHWFALVRTASTSAPLSNEGPSTERGTLSDAAPDEGVSEEANKLGNESSQALPEAGYAESIADQSLPASIGGDSAIARSRQHSRMIAGGATSQDKYFCIQIFHRAPGENTKQPKKQVCKWLSEIASFHAVLSEFIVEILLHPIFQETSLQRTPSGEMSEGLKNVLGISPVDSIRISGNVLAGLLDANSNENEVPPAFYGKMIRLDTFFAACLDLNSIIDLTLQQLFVTS